MTIKKTRKHNISPYFIKYVLFLCLVYAPCYIYCQPFTLNDRIEPVQLELHNFNPPSVSNAKGKINITEVNQVNDTLYFFVKGISIYSPIYVGIEKFKPDNPLEIGLYKMNWLQADRKGKTDQHGNWDEQFKTDMDFGIMVFSKAIPADYSILVWAGDETGFELPGVFITEDDEKEQTGAWGMLEKNIFYILFGLLIIFMAYFIIKRSIK